MFALLAYVAPAVAPNAISAIAVTATCIDLRSLPRERSPFGRILLVPSPLVLGRASAAKVVAACGARAWLLSLTPTAPASTYTPPAATATLDERILHRWHGREVR